MESVEAENLETDLQVLYLTTHAAQRQKERDIIGPELWGAIKYGTKEPSLEFGSGRWKYTWKDVAVITDEDSSKIITALNLAGPRVHAPMAVITKEMEVQHAKALERLKDPATWTSHTVAVIDTSGSMRKTDTEHDVSRAEMVWLTLAISFVAKALKSGEKDDSDVFSLVGMQTGNNEIFSRRPFDWILYNDLIKMQRTNCPVGPGDYFPALRTARSLLLQNQYGGCALALVFLSDGMPSDHLPPGGISHSSLMKLEIADIASRIGSRLSVLAVPLGVGTDRREFATLTALVRGAKIYGCNTIYQKPSLSAHVLGTALTKLTSTTTATKIELGQRVCRQFRKEPIENVGGKILNKKYFTHVRQQSFIHYEGGKSFTRWSIRKSSWETGEGWVSVRPEHTFYDQQAVGIAIKNAWFGEGAERLVKEIREVNSSGGFVGPLMVAKDTKYIHAFDGDDKLQLKKDFHKRFIMCQRRAQKCAKYFNRQLARHPAIDSSSCPQIEFLDCSVYMILHDEGEREAYLVENMLDIQHFDYQRWNDNKGGVRRRGVFQPGNVIEEEEEEGVTDDDCEHTTEEDINSSERNVVENEDTAIDVDDIPQAFSCFTYWFSKRHFLVCDLQGILNTDRRPPTFELTDAAVHHRMSTHEERIYGRTDHGIRGIQAFLSTHRCSNICRMVRAYACVPFKDIFNDEGYALPVLEEVLEEE